MKDKLIQCSGPVSRRGLIKSTLAASLGYTLGRNYIPAAWALDDKKGKVATSSGPTPEYIVAKGKAQRVILCWMGGGPSHLDTFDPKPGTKQAGGFEKGVEAADGLLISEKLPKLAKAGGKYMCVMRGLHSKEGDHGQASHVMHTGYREQAGVAFPSLGSIVCAEAKDGPQSELPSYVALNGGGYGPGFYGASYAPFSIGAGQPIPDLKPASGAKNMADRRRLLDGLDKYYGNRTGAQLAVEHQKTYDRAIKLANSPLSKLFETAKGDKSESYGTSGFAKACYIAKQLVSKGGVKFVEIDRGGWDNHAMVDDATRKNCEDLDNPMAKMVEELAAEGLLSSTLIIWMGEFGRTPDLNANAGRDHYPRCYTGMLLGGGVKGGQYVGKSNATGHEPEVGISVPDMFATICEICGIDSTKVRESSDGRPIQVADRGSKPVPGVFGA
ncbi:MAG: DUF1501 domain-containing protein [Planctomycetota bacterium]